MDQQAKEKLATQPNIYVDCKMLLGRLYDIRWKVPRRDRSYLFNDLLIPISLSLITHFRKAYKFLELKPGKQSFIIREKFKRNLRRVA